jgi:hypothetical protein
MPSGNALGVPAKDTLDADDNVFKVRKYQLEEAFGIGFDVLVYKHFTILGRDTDVHFSGVQIDAAVIAVLLIVKFHDVASFG